MGAHRERTLREVFTGTTLERVMPTGRHPVLMVNRASAAPYRRAVVASDLSGASAGTLRIAVALGCLGAGELAVVPAFTPPGTSSRSFRGFLKEQPGGAKRALTMRR